MPNRILKESICTSDNIDELSWFEEVLFYRLIVNCDDYGRFDGRGTVIKNRLFPLKENITVKSVEQSIQKLASVGLVTLYEFEGKPYLQLSTWRSHQTIRAKKSKYPPFDDDVQAIANNCKQLQANVPVIQSNPIRYESYSENENNACARKTPLADLFTRFWIVYPKKVGKKAAERAFYKIAPSEELVSKMLATVERQKKCEQWSKDRGQYIPNPATWLNQGRWDDEDVELSSNTMSSFETDDFFRAAVNKSVEGLKSWTEN